jgi:hypothetical protein
MSKPVETAVLDAVEFIGERSQLPLDELGIKIVDSEWGDAQQEVFYIRQELGEIPAERHPPNRTVTLKLQAKKEGTVSLAEAAQKLQQKVGILQKESGWIKRIFSNNAGASVDVGFEVYSAVLSGIQGWFMAHRAVANTIELVLTCSPYCYGTKELEGVTVVSANSRDREWEIASVKGTAPGLLRLRLKNTGTDWNALIGSIESKDHITGANSLLGYKATELTFAGGTEVEKQPPALNKVVKRVLTSEWQTILSDKITASGLNMGHVGGRRMLLRLYNEAALPTGNRLRLEWRSLAGSWSINEEVEVEVLGNWLIVDLGEAILERATLGEQAWEWRLQGRNAAGETTAAVYLDKIYPLAQEQYFSLRKQYAVRIPSAFLIQGEPKSKLAGEAINGATLVTGAGLWETAGSTVGDWLKVGILESGHVGERAVAKADTEYRQAHVSTPTFGNVAINTLWAFTNTVSTNGVHREYGIMLHGEAVKIVVIPQYIESEGIFRFYLEIFGSQVEQNVRVLLGQRSGGTAVGELNITLLGTRLVATYKDPLVGTSQLSANLTSTAVGKVGICDWNKVAGDKIQCNEFRVYEPEVDTLLHTNRSMNLGSNGVLAQHETKERWGELPLHDGFLPYSAPSYMEGRPLKGIVIPSQGDLESLADIGVNTFELTPFYRPAYHFMSEAA